LVLLGVVLLGDPSVETACAMSSGTCLSLFNMGLHSIPVVDAKNNYDDQNYNDESNQKNDVESHVLAAFQVVILIA